MDRDAIEREFPCEGREVYFNSAGATLVPASVRDAVNAFVGDLCLDPAAAYGRYLPRVERLRENLAGLMCATPDEIAITHHTAEATSIIANGLEWREGDTVMTLDREYPSTVYPWMNLEKRFGVRLVMLEERDGRVDEDEIVAAVLRERPRLLALSAVEWCSGYRFDLQKVGRACREAGTFFFVDAAQALGFCDIDVRACHVSAMAGSAWKWLFGPAGQGYLYLRRGLLDDIAPTFVGTESVVRPHDYLDFQFDLQPDMRRFEYSTSNLSALVWFDAGVRFLLGLGLDEIRSHVFDLQEFALERLQKAGCQVRGDWAPEHRSGIMAFRVPGRDSRELSRHLLREGGIVAQERDGFVRLAFHVYSTREGVERVVEALASSEG